MFSDPYFSTTANKKNNAEEFMLNQEKRIKCAGPPEPKDARGRGHRNKTCFINSLSITA